MKIYLLLHLCYAREFWAEEKLHKELLKNYLKGVRPINAEKYISERSSKFFMHEKPLFEIHYVKNKTGQISCLIASTFSLI